MFWFEIICAMKIAFVNWFAFCLLVSSFWANSSLENAELCGLVLTRTLNPVRFFLLLFNEDVNARFWGRLLLLPKPSLILVASVKQCLVLS